MDGRWVVKQGDVCWLRFDGEGSEPSGRRPVLVVQHDRFNLSAIRTTVVSAVTSDLRLAAMPRGVGLKRGEAGLSRTSVVNMIQIRIVDRSRLTDRIGTIARARMREVLRGLALLLGSDETE